MMKKATQRNNMVLNGVQRHPMSKRDNTASPPKQIITITISKEIKSIIFYVIFLSL